MTDGLDKGIHNLLVNCAGLKPHESVLIVAEDPALGWYDAATPVAIANAVREMGIAPTIFAVGGPGLEAEPGLVEAVDAHDCTIYLARVGDQDRFGQLPPGKKSVMCYIRSIEALASPYCTTHHNAMKAVKQVVDDILLGAGKIEVTCGLGTNFSGAASQKARVEKTDVSVFRFPLGVPMPLEATHFSGRVALAHFLTPTGSKPYEPASIALDSVAFAAVNNGRITGFDGNADDVARINEHYDRVAGEFSIDRNIVHSWHAGIHPASAYDMAAKDDPDRWSNTAFTNPRLLHFHTCGNYAPAEICWMVVDPTVIVDGVALWEEGRMQVDNFETGRACLEDWPELGALFANPVRAIGV